MVLTVMTPTPKFNLWCEQRVILAVVSGSWDKIAALDYACEFKALAAGLIDAPWAHIVYLEQWQLGVPEMEPVVQDLLQWCIDHNLRFAAQVYCPNMIKQYQLDRMIPGRTPSFERRVYSTQQQAFDWLASVGFAVEPQDLSLKTT
jgi:hypothetical protein